MPYKRRILRKAYFIFIQIAPIFFVHNTFGQNAVFYADKISLMNESRKDIYDQIMEAEWRINGKTLHYGSDPIEVTPDEKMDTIFYRQKNKAKWDTIICQISKPGKFTFVYNECCGGFNVKDESGHFIEAKVNFRIIGQKKRRLYMGTLGEAGLLVRSDCMITLLPGCRSAMSPNIYQLTLSEVDFPTDDSLRNGSTCLYKVGYPELDYDFAFRIIDVKFNFLFMPLINEPIQIIYDLTNGALNLDTDQQVMQPQKRKGRKSNKIRTIKKFGWGSNTGNTCGIELRRKYGFEIVSSGCIVTNAGIKHNIKTFEALTIRNGPDWWNRYLEEIKQCGKDCSVCEEEGQ
jgi:hypothetical protein